LPSDDSSTTLVQPSSTNVSQSVLGLGTASSVDHHHDNDNVGEQRKVHLQIANEPQIPIILVSPQPTIKMKDAQVGTDSHRTESERSPETRWTSPSSDHYDQDDPLTTKVVKVFKKSRCYQAVISSNSCTSIIIVSNEDNRDFLDS